MTIHAIMYIFDVSRYIKHIFFMYRCNSLIGFGGEMNDVLCASVVSGKRVSWLNENKALLIIRPLTYQDKTHIMV